MKLRALAIGTIACFALLAGSAAEAQIRLNDRGGSSSGGGGGGMGGGGSGGGNSGGGNGGGGNSGGGGGSVSSGDMIDGRDIDQIAAILRDQGYKAQVGKSSDGAPRISSSAEGLNFSVTTYSCGDDKNVFCSFDFFTYWKTASNPLPEKRINEWNKQWRFIKAYNDNDGDLNLVLNVELTGGLPKKNVARLLERWTSMMPKFDKFRQGKE